MQAMTSSNDLVVASSANNSDSAQMTTVLENVVSSEGASLIISSHDNDGKQVAPRLAARMNCGIVTGVTGLPDTASGFTVIETESLVT